MRSLGGRDKADLWERAAEIDRQRRLAEPGSEAIVAALAEAVTALRERLEELRTDHGYELWRLLQLANLEPWLDKKELAAYLSTSVRMLERWKAEGMPHAEMGGRLKFKVSQAEPWLEQNGHLERRGDWFIDP